MAKTKNHGPSRSVHTYGNLGRDLLALFRLIGRVALASDSVWGFHVVQRLRKLAANIGCALGEPLSEMSR